MNRNKAILVVLGLAALLSLVAGFLPLMKGGPLNVVFMGVGVVFAVLTAVIAGKQRPAP